MYTYVCKGADKTQEIETMSTNTKQSKRLAKLFDACLESLQEPADYRELLIASLAITASL